MATALKPAENLPVTLLKNSETYKIGLVKSEWNDPVTNALEKGAMDYLISAGILAENIKNIQVPGSFELTSGAQLLLETGVYDAVICLGCVIQGETRHFDFICQAIATGLTAVSVQYKKPVIFGVLTTDTLLQAEERSGGKLGNKGTEAALTALKMAELFKTLKHPPKATAGFK